MEILKELFDIKIIEILSLFIENPDKEYPLSEVSNLTKVNITATFRIIRTLTSKKIIKEILIGKRKVYRLEKNEKTTELLKILSKISPALEFFVEDLSRYSEIKKIILESKEKNIARLLIVADSFDLSKINILSEKIKEKYNFNIYFVIISENQYQALKNFKKYNLERNIIWESFNYSK